MWRVSESLVYMFSYPEVSRQSDLRSWLERAWGEMSGSAGDQRLAVAGVILEEMRLAVYEQTGFRCSAGISHNKVLGAV